MSDEAALRVMAERAVTLKHVTAPCRIELTRADGRTVRLDGAMAAQWPDSLRLRAWKLSRPVFDLTLRPDGLWIFQAGDEGEGSWGGGSLTAARLRRAWSLIAADLRGPGWSLAGGDGDSLMVTAAEPDDGFRIECRADRHTLTLRACTLSGDSADGVVTVRWSDYRVVDGVVWPLRVRLDSPAGSILILSEPPTFTEPPPPGAFEPPARAVRQP